MYTQSGETKSTKKTIKKTRLTKTGFDFGFLFMVILLLVLGLLMVFSASYPYAYYSFNDGLRFIKKQLIWGAAGIVAMFITANFDYRRYKKLSLPILIFTVVLLIAVPFIGAELNGAKRWLGVGGLTFQPSELAKLSLIMFFAASLSNVGDKIKKFGYLIRYCLIAGVFLLLFILEPHFSVCIIVVLTLGIMLLVSGAKIRHFAVLSVPAVIAVIILIVIAPYRLSRVTSFLDPFADFHGAGWQAAQSLFAIGSGGLFGVGFGNSRQKFLYISEPQNDFIFSIVCEELGLVGALAILVVFAIFLWRGMKIAVNAPDTFSSLLVTGIISLVGVQTVLNIAVVTSSLPNTGIPLPFFSAGGSSLLFLLAAMGIVLNVSKYKKQTI